MMTYARARLGLGITTVGFWVVLSTLLLATVQNWSDGLDSLPLFQSGLIAVLLYIGLSVPFDWLGGYVLPKRFNRTPLSFTSYISQWSRGVLVHGLFLLSATLLLGNLFQSVPYDAALFPLIALLLGFNLIQLGAQQKIASLIAPFTKTSLPSGEAVWGCDDPGFTGGLGLSSHSGILPERWVQQLPNEQLTLLQNRRDYINGSRPKIMGLIKASGFNVSGALVAYWLIGLWGLTPAAIGVLPFLLCWSSLITVWSFLGLLTLPTPSQWASVWADRAWKDKETESFESLIRQLDAWQDEEPNRSPGVQRIFHPIPSVEQRLQQLSETAPKPEGCYHLARLALYLSWPGLSWLSRAVHCNVGRPHLWVYLPADG